MAQDPWDWSKKIQVKQLAAPLAAMPQAQSSGAPSPVNTTGPLQQMVQQQVVNRSLNAAFDGKKPPTELAPVVDSVPATAGTGPQVGGPMSPDGAAGGVPLETMPPIAPLEVTGTDAALTTGAELGATEATATAAAEPGIMEMLSQAAMMFAADGTTSVPNKAKGGK